jgi:pyruvate ferredoxin oxidoreductase alpha subunit
VIGNFLPSLKPKYPTLDVDDPKVIGTVPLPSHYTEFKYDMHYSMEKSREIIKEVFNEFAITFGRQYDLIEEYKTEDADVILIGMGSLIGTAREAVDMLRHEGRKIGLLKIKTYRPFPYEEVAKTVRKAKVVAVIDRDISFGSGGILFHDVLRGLYNKEEHPAVINFIAGLGGRDITLQTIRKIAFEAFNVAKERLIKKEVFWPDARIDILKTWGWIIE